jgi:hypothetical protein
MVILTTERSGGSLPGPRPSDRGVGGYSATLALAASAPSPPLSNPGPAGGGVWRRPHGCSRASNCEELRAHQQWTLTTSACRFACDAVVWPVPQSPAAECCHHVRDDLEHARWQRCERRRERCAAEHMSITANEHLKPLQETV